MSKQWVCPQCKKSDNLWCSFTSKQEAPIGEYYEGDTEPRFNWDHVNDVLDPIDVKWRCEDGCNQDVQPVLVEEDV